MNIEIRAWHTVKKVMFPPEEMERDQLTLLPGSGRFINVSSVDERLSQIIELDVMIPMLYTGLKDKNGVKIFEGDILLKCYGSSSPVGVVEYHDERAAYIFQDGYNVLLFEVMPFVEVIGNIHENPELLSNG